MHKDGSIAIANIASRIRKKLNPDNPKDGYIKTVGVSLKCTAAIKKSAGRMVGISPIPAILGA